MLTFYWVLIRKIPGILFQATNNWLVAAPIITFVLSAVIFINRVVGKRLMTSWQGISPWWALLPIVLLCIYGVMRSNYEAFRLLEQENYRLKHATEKRKQDNVASILSDFPNETRKIVQHILDFDVASHTQLLIAGFDATQIDKAIVEGTSLGLLQGDDAGYYVKPTLKSAVDYFFAQNPIC